MAKIEYDNNINFDLQCANMLLAYHHEILEAFADVAPLLQSMKKLSIQESNDLCSYISHFTMACKEKYKENIIIKVHFLFSHLESWLDFYGMVGLVFKDSMESIHALVNQLSHVSGWRSTDSFGGMSYYCYE